MKAPPPGLSFMDKVSMGPGDLMCCEFNAIRTCMTMAASVRPKAADRCEACGDGPSKSNEALCANWCLVKGKLLPLRTGRLNRSTSWGCLRRPLTRRELAPTEASCGAEAKNGPAMREFAGIMGRANRRVGAGCWLLTVDYC